MDSLVNQVNAALSGLLDKPYAFFGHSMGGTIAYEWCRKIQSNGKPGPSHFFASASLPPHIPDNDTVHKKSYDEVVESAKQSGGFAPEILEFPELLELYVPILKADSSITECFSPVELPKLNCPITIFFGENDAVVDPALTKEWESYSTGAFQIHHFDQNHFFLEKERSAILSVIRQTL